MKILLTLLLLTPLVFLQKIPTQLDLDSAELPEKVASNDSIVTTVKAKTQEGEPEVFASAFPEAEPDGMTAQLDVRGQIVEVDIAQAIHKCPRRPHAEPVNEDWFKVQLHPGTIWCTNAIGAEVDPGCPATFPKCRGYLYVAMLFVNAKYDDLRWFYPYFNNLDGYTSCYDGQFGLECYFYSDMFQAKDNSPDFAKWTVCLDKKPFSAVYTSFDPAYPLRRYCPAWNFLDGVLPFNG